MSTYGSRGTHQSNQRSPSLPLGNIFSRGEGGKDTPKFDCDPKWIFSVANDYYRIKDQGVH